MEPKGIITLTNHRTDTKFLLYSSSNTTEIFNNICINFGDQVFQVFQVFPLYHGWKCFSLAKLNVSNCPSKEESVSLKCS